MIDLLAALTVAAQLAVLCALVAYLLRWGGRPQLLESLTRLLAADAVRVAWLIALVATLGSLYMSEVRHFPPCTLCWYQRIAMYPLVAILGVGLLRRDPSVRWYALPFAAIGAVISVYHIQLERFPHQETIACTATVPCTTVWFEQFGYITIPTMALSAFVLIAVVLIVGGRHGQGISNQA